MTKQFVPRSRLALWARMMIVSMAICGVAAVVSLFFGLTAWSLLFTAAGFGLHAQLFRDSKTLIISALIAILAGARWGGESDSSLIAVIELAILGTIFLSVVGRRSSIDPEATEQLENAKIAPGAVVALENTGIVVIKEVGSQIKGLLMDRDEENEVSISEQTGVIVASDDRQRKALIREISRGQILRTAPIAFIGSAFLGAVLYGIYHLIVIIGWVDASGKALPAFVILSVAMGLFFTADITYRATKAIRAEFRRVGVKADGRLDPCVFRSEI